MPRTRPHASPRPRRTRSAPRAHGWAVASVCVAVCAALFAPAALAQRTAPVYLQDSPRAAEALPRTQELADAELYDEAARVLYELTVSDGRLLIEAPGAETDPDAGPVLLEVRTRVNDILAARPNLLERYRELHDASARTMLDAGEARAVERDALLTRAGFDAALLIARDRLEEARFLSAWRTLAQLDRHPDRPVRAREAAGALSRLWSYIEGSSLTDRLDPGAEGMLRRWRRDAGLDADPPAPVEPPASPRVRTLFEDQGPVRLEGVLSQPILSRETGIQPEYVIQAGALALNSAIPVRARVLHMAPVLVGDAVYTNTGMTIAAWNRFSGQRLWERDVDAPFYTRQRFSRVDDPLKELLSVAVDDDLLVALTGLAEEGSGVRERLLLGLDPRTGDERWRLALSDQIGSPLQGALLTGPPALVEGTVVVRAIERDLRRRTIVHHLLGVDARTGEIAWERAVAGVGARPYGDDIEYAEGLTPAGPDVVYVSGLGAVVRVEAATGRIRWVRQASGEGGPRRAISASTPWRYNTPVVTRSDVVTLSPDRREILRLDAYTGELLGASPAGRWDDPHTLHLVNGVVVAVSERVLTMCPLEHIDIVREVGVVAEVPVGPAGTIRGRVTRAGDRLFVPTAAGLAWVAPPGLGDEWFDDEAPSPLRGTLPLERTGNALVVDGQVVVVDDQRVHTYFSWRVARELLERREADDPTDPGAPITFAQLAYRAGETGEILPALDRALDALARDPLRPDFDESRTRLFDAVLRMARPDRDPSRLGEVSNDLRRALLDRMERLASTPDERVASMMTAGAFFEAINAPAEAIQRYQRVLAREELRTRPFEGAGVRTPAATEVARRLTTILATHSRSVYRPYDDAARKRVQALGADASPEELLAVAREFPVARSAPELYLRAGIARAAAGASNAAASDFEAGLRAVVPGEQPELAGELAGRAVVGAARDGRYANARQRVREFRTIVPDAPLRFEGREIDTERLLAQLDRVEQSSRRRPSLGGSIDDRSDVLPGLRIQRPIASGADSQPARQIVLRRSQEDEIELWALDDDNTLSPRIVGLVGHDLLHLDDNAMYTSTLPEARPGRRVIHRIDTRTGDELWRTLSFDDLFDPALNGGINEAAPALDEADDAAVRAAEIVAMVTPSTLVLVERRGRAVAIDLESGRPVWARRLSLTRVLDADSGSGVIAAIGLRRRTIEELRRAQIEPSLVEERLEVIDERTGRTLHTPSLDMFTEWVRMTPEGSVLVGGESAIAHYDARSGRVISSETKVADIAASSGVSVTPGRAFVLSGFGTLIEFDTTTRSLDGRRIAAENLFVGTNGFRAEGIDGLAYIATPRGYFALDSDGRVVTGDTRSLDVITTLPVFASQHAVAVARTGLPAGPGAPLRTELFPVLTNDLRTGLLTRDPIYLPLEFAPDTVALLDGHILITAGPSTVLLHAPVDNARAADAALEFRVEEVFVPLAQPSPTGP